MSGGSRRISAFLFFFFFFFFIVFINQLSFLASFLATYSSPLPNLPKTCCNLLSHHQTLELHLHSHQSHHLPIMSSLSNQSLSFPFSYLLITVSHTHTHTSHRPFWLPALYRPKSTREKGKKKKKKLRRRSPKVHNHPEQEF